ncbi:substrate-binding domain-containing protein [Nakamurella leprariae]|uniref:Substrate-binding domain-containing protein n=1 Tax=Nakamurella leprariae TaxID=2803911 RepID=A0A939BZM1_9ACTN|nr:substrate-binding domain-containing protein [Nakamurella leprariae]MBM9467846.1 substrate-binding domain-containing protein [Nakamurella leprariae]
MASHRLHRNPWSIGVTATVMALTLTACGSSGSDSSAGGGSTSATGGSADSDILIGLVTKTDTNPFYVRMKEDALAEADRLGVQLQTFSGKVNNDNDSQVTAVENLIAAGADGILITPADSAAIVPTIDKARAAGIIVIALDTPTQPADAVEATYATDNFIAGQEIGKWAAAQMEGQDAHIALLDQDAANTSVDVARNQGFLDGFGIDLADETKNGDEDDPRIVGNYPTLSERDEGRTQMELALQTNPDINVVYAINEVVAAGAYEAIEAAGKQDDIIMVAVDGGCPGVQAIAEGTLGATSMQYPGKMAVQGMEAIVNAVKSGEAITETDVDTGVNLITDTPVEGLESEDSAWGLENCWG